MSDWRPLKEILLKKITSLTLVHSKWIFFLSKFKYFNIILYSKWLA